jgi:hypothetical protein
LRTFSDYDIVLFDHPDDGYGRAADKSIILDFFVKRALSDEMKCAWHVPYNIVGQTRQNLLVVGVIEAVHILGDGCLVLGHALSPLPVIEEEASMRHTSVATSQVAKDGSGHGGGRLTMREMPDGIEQYALPFAH